MASFEELGIKTKEGLGVRYATTCPKCAGTRKDQHKNKPCLTINNEEGNRWFNCNHCSWSGNLDLMEKYDQVYKAARMPKEKAKLYSNEVQDWMVLKHLKPEVCMQLGVYEVEGGYMENAQWVRTGHQEVAFPYYERHTLVNVMFRRLVYDQEKNYGKFGQVSKTKGTKTCFWGIQELELDAPTHHKPDQTHQRVEVIITEGQTDRITWVQCGYKNVLSIPMGAMDPKIKNIDKKLEFITDPYIVELFKKVHRFYIAMDNDEAGQFTKDLIADKLGKTRCFVINYPYGYKDSNEVYGGDAKKNLDPMGQSGIDEMYTEASAYPLKGIMELKDVKPYLNKLRTKGFEKGLVCGNKDVDELISIKPKMLMVITGIPGHGKSSWMRWYLTELCRNNPTLKWGMFSPESRPVEREYAKIQEVYAKKSYYQHHVNAMSDEQLQASERWVAQRFTLINPTSRNYMQFLDDVNASPKGLMNILRYMKHLKDTKGIYGFVIDAWNKIDHEMPPKGMSDEKFISKQLDYVLDFIEANNMFAIIIAHPVKIETIRGGNNRIPALYDIKGSSAWNEKADIGIIVYRKKYKTSGKKNDDGDDIWVIDNQSPCLLRVEKIKFDEQGREDQLEMWMDKHNGDQFTTVRPPIYGSHSKKKEDAPIEDKQDAGISFIPTDDLPF